MVEQNDNSARGVDKPRLLDLFCCAGGCSVGYSRVGFASYGIDNDPKPLRYYPFPYICMDALEAMDRLLKGEGLTFSNSETLYLADFVAFHASPPCQGYIHLKNGHALGYHPLLIGKTRERLQKASKPYCIENVPAAREYLFNPIKLCGTMFGLPLWKHRYFETDPAIYDLLNTCNHKLGKIDTPLGEIEIPVYCSHGGDSRKGVRPSRRGIRWRPIASKEIQLLAMGIDWAILPRQYIHEAIPPIYLEYIGKYLMQAVRGSPTTPRFSEAKHP